MKHHYHLAQQAIRASDIRTSLEQLAVNRLPIDDMRRMLTLSEFAQYERLLREARQEQLAAPSPVDLLSAAAAEYWDKAQALAHEIVHMRRRTRNPVTGKLDYNAAQKRRRCELQDEAATLVELFHSEVDESSKALFRENHTLFPRYHNFNELEAALPVLKTRKEVDPYGGGGVEIVVQGNCLRAALEVLRPATADEGLTVREQGQALRRLLQQ